MKMECKHKWKIIKEVPYNERGLFTFWRIYPHIIYHLQCSVCGDIKRRWTEGAKEVRE